MANFKRGRRKNARSGCIFCKPWKSNGVKGCWRSQRRQERRAREDEREQLGTPPAERHYDD
jgi:hypothetical protein